MAMTLRLNDDDERALRAIQAAAGVSKHQAAILAIHNEAGRTERHVELRGYARDLKEQYGDVLDRLAK